MLLLRLGCGYYTGWHYNHIHVGGRVSDSGRMHIKKWKNQRDQFVRELKVKKEKSGDAGPSYVPTLELYNTLLFLYTTSVWLIIMCVHNHHKHTTCTISENVTRL